MPKEFKSALVITFTGGIAVQAEEEQEERAIDFEESSLAGGNTEGEEETATSATVQPDVDLLLRNFAWQGGTMLAEPVVMLSLKTSLVDRAGMAARWKIYFDLATQPCCHQNEPDCAYRRLGIYM